MIGIDVTGYTVLAELDFSHTDYEIHALLLASGSRVLLLEAAGCACCCDAWDGLRIEEDAVVVGDLKALALELHDLWLALPLEERSGMEDGIRDALRAAAARLGGRADAAALLG